MISCEVFCRHVDTAVDGEIDPDTQIEFDQHLASCGDCRVHLGFVRSFKRQVREACSEELPAPADLRLRLRAALDREDERRVQAVAVTRAAEVRPPLGITGVKLLPMRARYAVPAAAAAVALAVLAASEGGNPVGESGSQSLDAQVANTGSIFEEVVRRHSSEHPAEMMNGPPTQVATWFEGELGFPVRPIDFGNHDARLVGARISNVRDREAAAFFYTVDGRRVTVMVFQPPAPVDHLARRTSVHGRGVYYGRAHGRTVPVVEYEGLTYAFTGDLDSNALLQLAATARVQGH